MKYILIIVVAMSITSMFVSLFQERQTAHYFLKGYYTLDRLVDDNQICNVVKSGENIVYRRCILREVKNGVVQP